MKTTIRAAALAAGCVALTACATITRGTQTNWEVKTSPSGASVKTSNGRSCAATPCTIRTSRKSVFTATISKPDYKPVDVQVSHEMSAGGGVALLGNFILGGVLGIVVDLVTGAPDDLTPEKVDLALQPDGSQLSDVRYAPPSAPASAGHQDVTPQPRYAEATTPAAQPRPADTTAPATNQGRVIAIRVLPDGSVVETRSPND